MVALAYDCDGAMATMVNFDIKYWLQTEFNGFSGNKTVALIPYHNVGLNTNNEQAPS